MQDASSVDGAGGTSALRKLALIAIGYVPLLHAAGALSMWFLPQPLPVRAIAFVTVLYVVPALLVRVTPQRAGTYGAGERQFLVWWWTQQLQTLFNRLPFLEELLRVVPALYSAWLRLFGARVGSLVYWAAGTRLLDRQLVRVGNAVVFGAGVRMSGHMMVRRADGSLELTVAPVTVGGASVVGAFVLLAPGVEVEEGSFVPATVEIAPHRKWSKGRARRADVSSAPDADASLSDEWRLKLLLSVALPLYFCLFYFTLQRVTLFEPRTLPLSVIDEWIPFDPRWTAVYQSLYLFLPAPWLARSREELRRYAVAFFAISLAGFATFFFFPVYGPRPGVAAEGLYSLLVRYDGNLNAFPSLHAALTVLTLLLVVRVVRSRAAVAFAFLWSALVLYSTMATKQHYAVDVAAGVLLALAGDAVAQMKRSRHASHPLVSPSGVPDPPEPRPG